jgi:hypothetical protein
MELKWIKTGIICGFLTMIIYPSMIFIDVSLTLTVILAFSFGILLMIGSLGIYHFITLNKKTVSLQIGVLFNIIACAVVILMFSLQLAIAWEKQNLDITVQKELMKNVFYLFNIAQLSFDVVWDVFISLGTVLIALNMLNHPKLGKIIGISGLFFGVSLLALNLSTFPIPPGEAGLIDIGPAAALWYLAVTVMMTLSLNWVKEKKESKL